MQQAGVTRNITINEGLNSFLIYGKGSDADWIKLDTASIYGVDGALTLRANALAQDYMTMSLDEEYHTNGVIRIGTDDSNIFTPGVGVVDMTFKSSGNTYFQTGNTAPQHPTHLPFYYTLYNDSDGLRTISTYLTSSQTVGDLYVNVTDKYCEADGIIYRNWLGGYQILPCLGRTVFTDKVSRTSMETQAQRSLTTQYRSVRDYYVRTERQITMHTGQVLPLKGNYEGQSVPVQGTAVAEIMSSPEVWVVFHDRPSRPFPVQVSSTSMEYKDGKTGQVSYEIKMTMANAAMEAYG